VLPVRLLSLALLSLSLLFLSRERGELLYVLYPSREEYRSRGELLQGGLQTLLLPSTAPKERERKRGLFALSSSLYFFYFKRRVGSGQHRDIARCYVQS